MDNVITIQNFRLKMPQFDPNSSSKPVFGLVDIGSNGIRFSISDLSPPRTRLLPSIYRERAGISLYDALHAMTPDSQPYCFSSKTITQVAQTLARFRGICNSYGVEKQNISVFATEAMRTAKNKDEMLQAIHEASGLMVEILSPEVESLFGAMGARSGFNQVEGLFMDLGGGSVQMTYMNSKEVEHYDVQAGEAAKSMPYGAAKLTAALSIQASAESSRADLTDGMKETFEILKGRFPQLREKVEDGSGITIYFCGGGFRGYGSMLMHTDPIKPYPIPAIGGYTVPGHRFIQWKEMLRVNSGDEKIYGLSKRRREQFPAIATVVEALVKAVPKINRVIFCGGGNREGVLYMKLPRNLRESHPFSLLPGMPLTVENSLIFGSITATIATALPKDSPAAFSKEHLYYLARNIWLDMGDSADLNSARALHNPISGLLAGLPGLTHETRGILALTMCARWGTDLGPADRGFYGNLRLLLGPELSWWCDYVGAIAGIIAAAVPAFPGNDKTLGKLISMACTTSQALGKKGDKQGIKLRIGLVPGECNGVSEEKINGIFNDVGKGLHLGRKIEVEVVDTL